MGNVFEKRFSIRDGYFDEKLQDFWSILSYGFASMYFNPFPTCRGPEVDPCGSGTDWFGLYHGLGTYVVRMRFGLATYSYGLETYVLRIEMVKIRCIFALLIFHTFWHPLSKSASVTPA